MIDPNKVTEAVMEFMQNPSWKEIFTNAPGGAMERLAIAFYFSKFHDDFKPEDFQEYRDLREEYEKSLNEEDLNYLIANSDKDSAIQHYQQLLEKLQQSGGQPQGDMRFEKEETSSEEQPGEGTEGQTPQAEKPTTTVEETETEETPDGKEEKKTVVAEETGKEAEQPQGDLMEDEGEKKNGSGTALSKTLNFLQSEEQNLQNGETTPEKPKTN